jgi:hypothetical protein
MRPEAVCYDYAMKQLKPASANPLASARPVKRLSRNTVLLILLAIVLGAAAFALTTHRTQQTRQRAEDAAFAADKARFAKVETEMAETYAAIVAAAGKPDVEKQTKNCSYIELKFEKGSLICGVTYGFTYGADVTKAAAIVRDVSSALGRSSTFTQSADLSNTVREGDPEQMASTDLSGIEDVICKLSYELGITHDVDKNQIITPRSAFFWLECSQKLNKPIYPLAN